MAIPPIKHISHEGATKIKVEPSKTHVTLKIQGDDHDVYYRMKRDFPLHHMKLDYCNRLGLEYGAIRFNYNGVKLSGTQTADDLQMKDGSAIFAWVDKTGG